MFWMKHQTPIYQQHKLIMYTITLLSHCYGFTELMTAIVPNFATHTLMLQTAADINLPNFITHHASQGSTEFLTFWGLYFLPIFWLSTFTCFYCFISSSMQVLEIERNKKTNTKTETYNILLKIVKKKKVIYWQIREL